MFIWKLLDPSDRLEVPILDGNVHVWGTFGDLEDVPLRNLFGGLVLGQVPLQFGDLLK